MNLNEKISNFFDQDDSLKNFDFFIFRNDGISIFHHSSVYDKNSAGALISSVWHASSTLMNFMPQKNQDEFRFSFDTSNGGIYILPIKFEFTEYLFALIFKNEMNPALVKNKMRDLKYKLEQFINKSKKSNAVKNVRKSYLFNEISEEEMDKLFSITNV